MLGVRAGTLLEVLFLHDMNLFGNYLRQDIVDVSVYEGMSLQQLARVVGVPVNTIINRLFQVGEVVSSKTTITLCENGAMLQFSTTEKAMRSLGFSCTRNEWFKQDRSVNERALDYANYYNVVHYKVSNNRMIFNVSIGGTDDIPKHTIQHCVDLQNGQERTKILEQFDKGGLCNCRNK